MTIGLRIQPQHRVYAGFALHALTMGSIFPRLPDIQQALGVQEGELGRSLIGTPIGTMVALTLASPLLGRFGFRRSLLAATPLVAITYALAVHASNSLTLFLLLIPVGLAIGCAEIILNVEADRTEALIGRRIMNRAHSFWSIGFFIAGLIGALLAHFGVSPQLHLALVVPVVLAAVAVFLGRFSPAPARPVAQQESAPRLARPTLAVLVLVAVTLSAMLMEGAGMDWSAIYMGKVFASGPFVAGFAVALVAFCQAVARFFADGFVETYSPASVARWLLCALAGGVTLVLVAAHPAVSLLGFGLIGFGTSALFPLAMSAAAQRMDRSAVVNVAALVQMSFMAFLLGPPLLGSVAEQFGIQWAFGIGLPFILLSFVTAGALGRQPQVALANAAIRA